MPRYDFTTQRLFTKSDIAAGSEIELDRAQANYLLNVLRLKTGDPILLFNGRNGEWRAELISKGRKKASLCTIEQTRTQPPPSDLLYMFAPLKQARLEYMVQKAVEMGAGILQPVLTHHSQMRKVNTEKMRAYAIEAAEQCGILAVPTVRETLPLNEALETFEPGRHLVFCDEGEKSQNPLQALENLMPGPMALLIGPEGGFSENEREHLRKLPFVTPIPLGPRVLRADTAAVAALAIMQARLGDWHD